MSNGTTAVQQKRNFIGQNSGGIASTLDRYAGQIQQAIPEGASDLNAQRIIQIAATLIAQNQKLAECDAGSVIAAVMQAAILGLNPLPQLAEAFFVPYKQVCTFQTGYRGWINLYHRCAIIREVYAVVVRQGDEFEYEEGLHRRLVHRPNPDIETKPDGANITYVYAVANYTNGGANFVVLPKSDVERLKRRGSGGPAWTSDYPAMAMAKALKQLHRFIPSDGSINGAIASDERKFKIENLSKSGDGIDLASLEPVEAETIDVKRPSFVGAATGTDVANGLAETDTNAIDPMDTIERVGAELYGDAWPVERSRLCTEVSFGGTTTPSNLTPVELTVLMDMLTKEVETRTAAQTKKGAK